MRRALAVLLMLCSLPFFAQEASPARDAVAARLAAGETSSDIQFDLTSESSASAKGAFRIALSVPVDQLRFVEDGAELAARFSVLSAIGGRIARVFVESHRVAAPRGTEPQGAVTRKFALTVDRGVKTVTIVVVDENSGLFGTRTISIDGTQARVEAIADGSAAEAWKDVLARANVEKKPIVVFYRSRPCARCRTFERASVPHPTIQSRLPSVIFAVMPANEPGVAFFDRSGTLRARWPIIPDTTNFGVILDSVIAVAPYFERAVQLAESGAAADAELAAATGLAKLERISDARAALARARASGSPETRQAAIIAGAMLDVKEGKAAHALAELEQVVANATTPKIAVDAQSAIDALRRPREATPARGAIRILPLARQLVSGRQTVRTHIASAAVARVSFALDGVEIRRVERPPFSTTLDFGSVPERHSIRVVAFDRGGRDLGRDELVVNEAGETFWLRLVTPREGFAGGAVRVSMNVRVPAARRVQRVVVSWNAAERAVLTAAPWESTIDIPRGEVGVLRAVAELDDGRASEDAVLLNAGMVDQANVQLVELPLTIVSRDGSAPPKIASDRITVREGKNVRRVEAIANASETPLTVGVLIDVSDSMQKTLPDVQEAAIRFLETTLGPRDRAFVVTFDTRARLVQPATSDLKLLRRQLMSIRPDGLTALHDAIVLGLLQFEGIKGRRAMIVFSDGIDIASRYAASDVAELARRVSVPIHIIASTPGVPAALSAIKSSTAASSDDELARIARSTGGTAHTLDSLAALPRVYATIQSALAAQILAYVRTDPATRENEWRGVQIEVTGSDLDVYAPAGYYASW